MNMILCMLCALVLRCVLHSQKFCGWLLLHVSGVSVFLPVAVLEMWILKYWNGNGEVSALGDSKSWYVGHCPSSPVWLTVCFGLCVTVFAGQGSETWLWLEQNFPYTMVWEAVSLNFWFSSMVVMSCSFLTNCFLERGFYFPGLSACLLDRVDISVLPHAFQKDEENRAEAFCVTM